MQHHKLNLSKITYSLALAGCLSASTLAAQAQEASNAQADNVERIEVSGFRNSLIKAKDLKREAVGSKDSIVASDIAEFPDLNLADALQRIPGIAITREAGEGRQISLRGLGADFTQVQLNGMEALGTSDSPMDSRGAVSRSRAFDFNIFAAELFNQVDVQKSFAASQDEGGIGGTVGLFTSKPFDYDGFKAAVSGQLGDNSLADGTSPRIAGLISNTWGDFGALLSVAYSQRDTNEQGYDTYRWRRVTSGGSDLSNLSAADQEKINNAELYFARGARYSTFLNDQSRLGTTLALQYRPNDAFSLTFDALYGKLDNGRDEYHLQSRGSQGSTAMGCAGAKYLSESGTSDNPLCSVLVDMEYNDNNEVVYSEWQQAAVHSESRTQSSVSTLEQYVLTGNWQVNSDLSVRALLGHEKSEFEQTSAKVYLEAFGDQTIDFTQDPMYGVNTYGFDTTDVNEYRYHEIDIAADKITNSFDSAKLDMTYALPSGDALKFGLSYKAFENVNDTAADNDEYKNAWSLGTVSDVVDEDFTFTNTAHKRQSWLSINVQDVLDKYDLDRNLTYSINDRNKVTEKTQAAYAQYDFDSELGQGMLRGNVGVRYYSTEIGSEGYIGDEFVSIDRDYSGALPALNLAWDLTDSIVLRASASQNLTRPALTDLEVSGTIKGSSDGAENNTLTGGNPALKPYKSNNLEASFEYYFEDEGYASLGLFYKNVQDYIISVTQTMTYAETGYPDSLLPDGVTSSDTFEVTMPENMGEDTKIKGFEVNFQHRLDFLPAPLDNLGVITNYTWADSKAYYDDLEREESLPGLSKNSGNFTLYYDTDTWGARVSAAYRSKYLTSVAQLLNEEDYHGFHATTYVDASAFYNVSEAFKITLEGSNLTDQREEQFSNSTDRLYNTTHNGRTYYLGFSYSM